MIKFVFTEIKKIIIPSILVIISCTIYNYVYISNYFNSSVIWSPLEPWSSGGGLLDFIFPLLVATPYCWQVFYENKGNYFQYIHTRKNLKKYLINKCIITALVSGLTIIIINIIGFSLAIHLGADAKYSYNVNFHIYSCFLGKFQVDSPIAYSLILTFWRGFIGMLICVFGFIMCLLVKNFFVAITSPFIYYVLENFITAILGKPAISLTTSITPNRLSAEVMSYSSILVGPIILCVVIILLLFRLKFMCTEKYKK